MRLLKQGMRGRDRFAELLPHAHRLRALAGKQKGNFGHGGAS
jgi:hypothetical protein